MKSAQQLQELAATYGIKTYRRMFIDVRTDDGRTETRFVDVPKPRKQLVEELREAGAFPDSS